jgi:hypothetical protein
MMIHRRGFLKTAGAAVALATLPAIVPTTAFADVAQGMSTSPLIYITPLKADGGESSCQAEVWFQLHEGAMYVVTSSTAWRAVAIGKGMKEARIWVGDVGPWQQSEGKYKSLAAIMAEGAIVGDKAVHDAVLAKMGGKYPSEWGTWGPRFRNGLADGSRVMLRYAVA